MARPDEQMFADQVQQLLVDLIEQVRDAEPTTAISEPASQQVFHRAVVREERDEVEPAAHGRVDEGNGPVGCVHRPDEP